MYPTRTKKYFTKNKGIIYYNKWRAITGLYEAYYEIQPRDSIDRRIYQVGTFYVKKGVNQFGRIGSTDTTLGLSGQEDNIT